MDLSSGYQLTHGLLRRRWRERVTAVTRSENSDGKFVHWLVAAPPREGGGRLQMEEEIVDSEV